MLCVSLLFVSACVVLVFLFLCLDDVFYVCVGLFRGHYFMLSRSLCFCCRSCLIVAVCCLIIGVRVLCSSCSYAFFFMVVSLCLFMCDV